MTTTELLVRAQHARPLPELPAPAEAKRLRLATGVTQEQAAICAEVSIGCYYRYEAGMTSPKISTGLRLRKLFAVLTEEAA